MPAPRNLDELKQRTLHQIDALKAKGVKTSGRKINEYLSGRDLTGPSHRNIMKSTPGRSMINNFKEKRQPHYNNISALLALNTFIGVHAKVLKGTDLADDDYCTPDNVTDCIKESPTARQKDSQDSHLIRDSKLKVTRCTQGDYDHHTAEPHALNAHNHSGRRMIHLDDLAHRVDAVNTPHSPGRRA